MQNKWPAVASGNGDGKKNFRGEKCYEQIVKMETKGNHKSDPAASKQKAKVGRFSEKGEAWLDILRGTNANKYFSIHQVQ